MSKMPKLRFKEFSGEWDSKTIGNIGHFFSGGTPTSSNKSYYSGSIPFIGSGKIGSNVVEQFITEEALSNSSAKMVDVGDLLYALYGATSGEVALSKINGAINQAVLCIRTEENKIFLKTWLEKNKNKILSTYLQGGQGNLSAQIVKSLKLNLPSKPEQEKIALFLISVDTKIEQLIKKEKLLQEYKKGVLDKIFNKKIRFKDNNLNSFPDWEEKSLGEILAYEQPTKYIVKSTEYDDSHKTPVLTAGKTFILGYTNETDGILTNTPVIIFDDFTTSNNFVDFDFKVKSSAMKILKLKPNINANIKLVYEFMQKIQFPIGEHKRYWISEYQFMNIPFPSLAEQTKIANFLSSIDTKIEQVQTQLASTKEFKKALLQQMFI